MATSFALSADTVKKDQLAHLVWDVMASVNYKILKYTNASGVIPYAKILCREKNSLLKLWLKFKHTKMQSTL